MMNNEKVQVVEQAMLALQSNNSEQRAQAIEILGEHQHQAAVPRILELLETTDPDPGTRYIIVQALGRISDESAVPALLNSMREPDIWTRAAATGALINIGRASVNGLVDALRDSNKAVRRAAAKALGKIETIETIESDDAGVFKGLSFALLDVDDGVRKFAAQALGRLSASHKVAELQNVLSDKNPDVRIAAFKALAEIGTPEAQAAVRNWSKQ